MSEPDHSVQVQVSQQFDSLATFKLAMIRWAINSGQEIKISKTDKKRTVYVCNIVKDTPAHASVSFIHKRAMGSFKISNLFAFTAFFILSRASRPSPFDET
jgi:hypothetical protein